MGRQNHMNGPLVLFAQGSSRLFTDEYDSRSET